MLCRKVQILRPASMFNSAPCCIMQTRHLRYNKKITENLQLAVYTCLNLRDTWLWKFLTCTVSLSDCISQSVRQSLTTFSMLVGGSPSYLMTRTVLPKCKIDIIDPFSNFLQWHTEPIRWRSSSTCSHVALGQQPACGLQQEPKAIWEQVSTGRSATYCNIHQHGRTTRHITSPNKERSRASSMKQLQLDMSLLSWMQFPLEPCGTLCC